MASGYLRYTTLSTHPDLVHNLTGRSVEEIDVLADRVPPRRKTTRGRSWLLSSHDELLLALVYRHRRVGQPAIAALFGISPSAVQAIIRHIYVALGEHEQAPGRFKGCGTSDLFAFFPMLTSLFVPAPLDAVAQVSPPSPKASVVAQADEVPLIRISGNVNWDAARQDYLACETEISALRRQRMALRNRLMTELYVAANGRGAIPARVDDVTKVRVLRAVADAHIVSPARARAAAVILQQALGLSSGEIAALLGVTDSQLANAFSAHVAALTAQDLATIQRDWVNRLQGSRGEMVGNAMIQAGTQHQAQILLEETADHYGLSIADVMAHHTPVTRPARVAASLLLRSLLDLPWERITPLLRGQTAKALGQQASLRRLEGTARDLSMIEPAWRARIAAAPEAVPTMVKNLVPVRACGKDHAPPVRACGKDHAPVHATGTH